MNKAVAVVLLFYAVVAVISGCYIVSAFIDQPDTKLPYRIEGRKW